MNTTRAPELSEEPVPEDVKVCPGKDKRSPADEVDCMKGQIEMRQGAALLGNRQFCSHIIQIYVSLSWFFDKEEFDEVYKICYAAKQNEKQAWLKFENELLNCKSRKNFRKTITLSKLPSSKRAVTAVNVHQLEASSDGIKNVQAIFEHCLANGSETKSMCASEVPSVEELGKLSTDGLSFMIVYVLDMILDLHIIKEKMSSSTKRKRAFVWLKTKPCALRTCMMCGLKGDMCWDHIFSSHCSRNFAKLVQECLSEWPERTSNVFLNWVYAKMYQDVPQLNMVMHLKNKARELERAVATA
jgi:hypothetical protein